MNSYSKLELLAGLPAPEGSAVRIRFRAQLGLGFRV